MPITISDDRYRELRQAEADRTEHLATIDRLADSLHAIADRSWTSMTGTEDAAAMQRQARSALTATGLAPPGASVGWGPDARHDRGPTCRASEADPGWCNQHASYFRALSVSAWPPCRDETSD